MMVFNAEGKNVVVIGESEIAAMDCVRTSVRQMQNLLNAYIEETEKICLALQEKLAMQLKRA